MAYIFPFEKLDVYQMALELADYILGLLERIPLNKHFRLVSQTEAAVVSVAQNIAEGAKTAGMKEESVRHFDKKNELVEYILKNISYKDVVLVKGSRSMKMEEVVDKLIR